MQAADLGWKKYLAEHDTVVQLSGRRRERLPQSGLEQTHIILAPPQTVLGATHWSWAECNWIRGLGLGSLLINPLLNRGLPAAKVTRSGENQMHPNRCPTT